MQKNQLQSIGDWLPTKSPKLKDNSLMITNHKIYMCGRMWPPYPDLNYSIQPVTKFAIRLGHGQKVYTHLN